MLLMTIITNSTFQKKGRVYEIGGVHYEIPFEVIQKFEAWKEESNTAIDERFVRALLLVLVPRNDLQTFNVAEDIKDFIKREYQTKSRWKIFSTF